MDTVEQIVALAQLRWLQAETVQVVLTGKPSGPGPNEGNLPKWSEWEASIRLGGGEWGDHVGVGKCPDLALQSLLGGLLAAHKAVDVRRAEVLAKVTEGHLPKETESQAADAEGALKEIAEQFCWIGTPASPTAIVAAVKGERKRRLTEIREASWLGRCAALDTALTLARETSSSSEIWTLLHKLRGEDQPTYPDDTP